MAPKVTILEFHGRLAIIPRDYLADIGMETPDHRGKGHWWPTSGGRLGCVLGDTARHLACSEQALALMDQIKCGGENIGDIDWWWCTDGTYAFSWWGPIFRLMDINDAGSCNGFRPRRDQCTIVPNDPDPAIVPELEAALLRVDADLTREMWREPYAIAPIAA